MSDGLKINSPFGEFTIPFNEEAVLDFARKINHAAESESTLEEKAICDYLNSKELDELESEWLFWEDKKVPVCLHDLDSWLNRDFEIKHTSSYSNYGRKLANIIYQKFKYPEGEKRFATRILYFLTHKHTGISYVWKVMPLDGIHIECQIFVNANDEGASIEAIKNSFDTFVQTEGVLKNNAFNANYQFISKPETTFQDVVMSEEQDRVIQRNIVKFVGNLSFYEERNLPTSRGVLITGPPGTGKTLTCSAVMNEVECTLIYITADAIQEQGKIEELYELAQGLSPTVVIVEDIDTLGGLDRRETGNHPLLGEFLNCMNGVKSNDGVITIATTNYPEHLDKALTRAGRFDIKLEFGLPNEKLRMHILEKYISETNRGKKIKINELVKKTEGFTGAFLKEIVMLATISAFEENGYDSKTKIEQKHLEEALDSLLENRNDHLQTKQSTNTGFHH